MLIAGVVTPSLAQLVLQALIDSVTGVALK